MGPANGAGGVQGVKSQTAWRHRAADAWSACCWRQQLCRTGPGGALSHLAKRCARARAALHRIRSKNRGRFIAISGRDV